MVTFTDCGSPEFPDLEAFLAARRIVRTAAADQLRALCNERRDALEAIGEQYQKLRADIAKADVSIAEGLRLSLQIKAKQTAEQTATVATYDGKINDLYARYSLRRSVREQTAADARDYLHATDAFHEDQRANGAAGIDPVLEQLPGVRRRRDAGWTVYEIPQMYGLMDSREVLRCDPSQVIVRGADDDRIKAGLLVAAQRYDAPIRIDGTPEFVRRSATIAHSLGLKYEIQTTAHTAAQTPGAAPAAQETAAAKSPTDVTPEDATPDYRLMPSDERLIALKEKYGASFASSLTKMSGVDVVGTAVERLAGLWESADGIVVRPQANARAIIVVPVDKDLSIDLPSEVQVIAAENGRCAFTTPKFDIEAEETLSAKQAPETGDHRENDFSETAAATRPTGKGR